MVVITKVMEVAVKILKQKVEASEFIRMVNQRLEMVTTKYNYAVASDDKVSAECLAETKWQLAELKMQLCDFLIEQLQGDTND